MSSTTAQMAQKLYISYFGRPADPAGYTNAMALLNWNGGSPEVLLNDFGKSAEYTAQFANMTAAQKVNQIYQNLFGRAAESAGLNFWAAKVDSGEITLAKAAWTILSGVTAGSGDDTAVNSKVTFAESFTAKLVADNAATVAYNSSTLASVKAQMAAVTTTANLATQTTALDAFLATMKTAAGASSTTGVAGATFTLTTGNDYADTSGFFLAGGGFSNAGFKFTTANEVVTASNTTLTADILVDGSTADNDTLNYSLALTNTNTPTITNIENIVITASNTGAATTNFVNVTGAKTLTVSGTPGADVSILNIASSGITTVNGAGLTTVGGDLVVDFSTSTSTAALSITGGTGGDTITTAAGNDYISGGAGADNITSGSGNDTVLGGGGGDTIVTGTGADVVTGGGGNDTITVGTAGDTDRDKIIFESTASGNGIDTINGFTHNTAANGADILDVSAFLGKAVSYIELGLPTTATDATGKNVVVFTDEAAALGNVTTAFTNMTFTAFEKVVVVIDFAVSVVNGIGGDAIADDAYAYMFTADGAGKLTFATSGLFADLDLVGVTTGNMSADNFA